MAYSIHPYSDSEQGRCALAIFATARANPGVTKQVLIQKTMEAHGKEFYREKVRDVLAVLLRAKNPPFFFNKADGSIRTQVDKLPERLEVVVENKAKHQRQQWMEDVVALLTDDFPEGLVRANLKDELELRGSPPIASGTMYRYIANLLQQRNSPIVEEPKHPFRIYARVHAPEGIVKKRRTSKKQPQQRRIVAAAKAPIMASQPKVNGSSYVLETLIDQWEFMTEADLAALESKIATVRELMQLKAKLKQV